MEEWRVTRRPAAIVAIDIVGFSRLAGLDEEGTLARLEALRQGLIDPAIAGAGGRIVKTTGDGLLVEFGSSVDAVRCAIDVQRGIRERQAGLAPDRRVEVRVDVHAGDVVVDDVDLLGDGVYVAAGWPRASSTRATRASRTQDDRCASIGSISMKTACRDREPLRRCRRRSPGSWVLPLNSMSGDPDHLANAYRLTGPFPEAVAAFEPYAAQSPGFRPCRCREHPPAEWLTRRGAPSGRARPGGAAGFQDRLLDEHAISP